MELNKLYIKVGTYEQKEFDETTQEERVVKTIDNCIIGYFKQFTPLAISGKAFKIGCNFDETTDFENAIITDLNENEIEVGKDKFINGKLVKGE